MIKANELRIGNWVLDDGEPGIISGIGFGGISFFTINGFNCNRETGSVLESGIDKFKPIPLTPEILVKAGFKRSIAHHLDYFKQTGIWNNSFGVRLGRPFNHSNQWWPEIKYLHQLQNLYFALTGEELTVNFKELTYQ